MKKQITIYSMVDPSTNSPFYVGQTFDLKRRILQHNADHCSNDLYDKLKKLSELGLKPNFNVLEICSEDKKFERELFWINSMSSLGFSLINRQCKKVNLNSEPSSMVEKLLKMSINQTEDFTGFDYDSIVTTKHRLKRKGKGEWTISSKDGEYLVKRIK